MATGGSARMLRGMALAAALSLAGCTAPAPMLCSAAELERHCAITTELFLGLSRPDGSVLSEADFRGFLADVVTPLFPDGFTVLSGEGQWRDPATARIGRETSRVLVIVHDKPGDDGHIDALIAAYKKAFLQQSVLRVDLKSVARF